MELFESESLRSPCAFIVNPELLTKSLSVPPVVTDKVLAAERYKPKSVSEEKLIDGAEFDPFVPLSGSFGSLAVEVKV